MTEPCPAPLGAGLLRDTVDDTTYVTLELIWVLVRSSKKTGFQKPDPQSSDHKKADLHYRISTKRHFDRIPQLGILYVTPRKIQLASL